MTSRERIMAVINRQPVDRIPVDVWLTPEAETLLDDYTGEKGPFKVYQKLGVDKIHVNVPTYKPEACLPGCNHWGVPSQMIQAGAATYWERGTPPLAGFETIADLEKFHWPSPENFDYEGCVGWGRQIADAGFAVSGPWVSHFEIYCAMRGIENALMDVAADPEFMAYALERIRSIHTVMLTRFLDVTGSELDIVLISDDMGSQEGPLLDPRVFAKYILPGIAQWCDISHAHGKKTLFHTDGASREFIPMLIDAGIDILNPIQHICPGMERESLKANFGDKLIFHGGIENQKVLPFGTADDVRKETIRCLETLGADGGYIPCSCHNVQAGTPLENILAMFETVHAWKA